MSPVTAAASLAVSGPACTIDSLYGEAPLLLRRTAPGTVHLVGGAAGPLGGDKLRLDVSVGAGAHLTIHSVAATMALPGSGTSTMDVVVSVGDGARLDWLPEPLIAARACAHVTTATIRLAPTATLVWRDELVCGRHGEPPGDATITTAVTIAGHPLYTGEISVGPGAPGWDGPAVLGGAKAQGTVLVVSPAWAPAAAPSQRATAGAALSPRATAGAGSSAQAAAGAGPSPRAAAGAGLITQATTDARPSARVLSPTAALMPLVGPAVLAAAVGTDLREVRAALNALTPPLPSHLHVDGAR